MALPVLLRSWSAAQVSGERSDHRRSVEAVLDRASKERDLDGAGVALSALLSDESRLRRLSPMSAALDGALKLHPFRRKLGFRCRRHMD